MKTRVIGVVTTLAAITVTFIGIVLTIAAIQDYQENKGESFIERAASIVGFGTLTEEVAQVKVDAADEDVDESEKRSSDPSEIFRFFGQSEDNEEWFDDFFERRWLERDDPYRFEDRIERSPPDSPFNGWEFAGFVPPDWLDDLVERGVMTQKEVDQLKSWLENLPDSFSEEMPTFPGNRSFEFDSDDGRFRFRGEWQFSEPEDDSADEHKDDDKYELVPNRGISF